MNPAFQTFEHGIIRKQDWNYKGDDVKRADSKMPLSHPKEVTTQSNRVRRKVLKSFEERKLKF